MRSFVTVLAIAGALVTSAGIAATAPLPQPVVSIAGHRFSVELATTPVAQERGLMDRTSLAPTHGMLFVFPDSQPRTFWMKNTLIPLDILFFSADRRLVTIQADAQPCKADPCKLYPSNAPVRYVLEVNAGTAATLGLRPGATMSFSGVPTGTQ